MVPMSWPSTSRLACILRATLSVKSCGTWQSGQRARTPLRLFQCTVFCSSGSRLSCMVWQLRQNSSVLVTSSAVLKPCQASTPATKPPVTSTPSPILTDGLRKRSRKDRSNFFMMMLLRVVRFPVWRHMPDGTLPCLVKSGRWAEDQDLQEPHDEPVRRDRQRHGDGQADESEQQERGPLAP